MKPSCLFILCLTFSGLVLAEPNSSVTEVLRNPFETSYKAMRQPVVPATEVPKIFRGVDRASDDQRLLEDGFDIIGYSRFEAGDVAPDMALEQAARLKADMVLVYTKRAGGTPASVKMERMRGKAKSANAEAGSASGDTVYYSYEATYWSRLPPPVLGLHVRDLQKDEAAEQGVLVMAVIKGSPAEIAGLDAGDVLTAVAGTGIKSSESLVQASRRYAGKQVELAWLRGGETMRQTVKLNEVFKN